MNLNRVSYRNTRALQDVSTSVPLTSYLNSHTAHPALYSKNTPLIKKKSPGDHYFRLLAVTKICMRSKVLLLIAAFVSIAQATQGQSRELSVIAYYSGGPEQVAFIPADKLTHIIFSFCHLKGNRLA